jgi:hypothetical protein
VGLALVALALVATDALLWQPGVTEANVKRIREGMTVAEVNALLGDEPEIELGAGFGKSCRWWSEQGAAWVHFDENGRAEALVTFQRDAEPSLQGRYGRRPRPAPDPGLLPRLRAWVGW